jgi:hypothetical protein
MRISIFILFIFASCMNEPVSPEGALKEFVESRFGNNVTRQFFLDKVTGEMKKSLKHMEEEDFQKFADLRYIKQDSFKILAKSCQERKCFLTYSVAYKSTFDESAFASEVKKIAEIVQVEEKWLISNVSNIKTFHEALVPINPLDD